MAANKGLINIFKNGLQEAFYPKTIYESVFKADGSLVTLKDELTALQSFQSSATTKLSGIEEGANKYVHPTTSGNKHVPTGGVSGQILRWSADGTAVWGNENNTTYGVVTGTTNGLMSAADKTKLDGIATGANNYVHPDTASIRHVTDEEKATWNAKETPTGAQAKADKALTDAKSYADTKVAGIVDSAPEALDTLKELSAALGDDPNFSTTVMTEIGKKVDKVTGMGLSSNDYTTAEKTKLAGIAANANNYVHPTGAGSNHIPAGGATNQILRWTAAGTAVWSNENNTTYGVVSKTANGLVPMLPDETTTTKFLRQDGTWVVPPNTTYGVATTSANGLMSSTDKSKLDGVAANANNYTHPTGAGSNHIPTGGTVGQILKNTASGVATWANETTYVAATTLADGLMASTDKTKLDGIETGANKYVHPSAHDASMITESTSKRFVSDSEKATWNAKASTAVATSAANGLMSSSDKSKLDGVAANANNYVHPSGAGNNHIPTGGTTGQILRWSAAGTAVWGAEVTYSVASTTANGLMSSADKSKLDGIETGANNYVHPDTASVRHVTDTEKATWNAKETTSGAQAKADKALTDAKSYADTKVAGIVNSAPETMDTLAELAAALGDDPNFSTTVMSEIGKKVDKVTGMGLSSNDYTTTEKNKLAGIAANANNYSHPTGAGNNHIPAGGSANQILRWTAAGTAVWSNENNTTYGVATSAANGLMSSTDKSKFDTLVSENVTLKQILAMVANMNGYSLDLTASMTEISAAFTELYNQSSNMQFIYGDITPVS